MSLSVAVVGAGPSGLYAADRILKKDVEARVDVIDQLPTPYGLVRAGVAPDHQGTKNVAHQYARILSNQRCRFIGNVRLERDLSLTELQALYDAVVLATGAPDDRKLGIPGEELKGVYGSAAFTGWYNGHPDYASLSPLALKPKRVVVIGNGNVSLDIVRLLAKQPDELSASDLCAHARQALSGAQIESVSIAGRRGPLDASFTPPELRELGQLAAAAPLVEEGDLPDQVPAPDATEMRVKLKNIEIMRSFREVQKEGKTRLIHFLFRASPLEFIGDERVTGVRFAKTVIGEDGRAMETDATFVAPADLVVTAIGYKSRPLDGAAFDDKKNYFRNSEGKVDKGLYVVGWARRGPSGTIPTNRADSFAVADQLLAEMGQGAGKPGPEGLDRLLEERSARAVSFEDWLKIDNQEVARATAPAPREKFVSVQDMLTIID